MRSAIKLLLCGLIIWTSSTFAFEEHEKAWLGAYFKKPLTTDQQWLYSLYTQMRFINTSHPWQEALLEGAVGRQLTSNKVFWLGFRWIGQNPYNYFYQTYQLFEQLNWHVEQNDSFNIASRTRLEEIRRSTEGETAFRLRERLSTELIKLYFGKLNPLFYDELFFQLNATNYTSHQFICENRLFIGYNWHQTKNTTWEVGYINQYLMPTPQNNQSHMNHIIAITYNSL